MSDTTEMSRICDQLDRAFGGASWHGPPILVVLAEVTVTQAVSRPIPGAHSAWELVHHITSWLSIVRKRAGGEAVHEIPTETDWPPVEDVSAAAWQRARQNLKDEYNGLRAFIAQLSDDDLGNRVEGKLREYTVYQDLHGVIQHSLYHTGQIALLVKAAG